MPSLSVAVRNAMLNALIATIGASPSIEIRTGSDPGVTSADSGTLLATFDLASSWADAAADGSIHLSSTPLSATSVATGEAGHFRFKSSSGTTHMSGDVTETGGGGDLTLDSVSLFSGRLVAITAWYLNTPN